MLDEKWGSVTFKVFELILFQRCLERLLLFEMVLNKQGKTLEPTENIQKIQSRLGKILMNYNLNNPYALTLKKKISLTCSEWKTLQNSLCITLGLQKAVKKGSFPQEVKVSDEALKYIKRLHRRFELFPVRIIAGMKAKGYKVDEQKARQIIEEYKKHEPNSVIKKLI